MYEKIKPRVIKSSVIASRMFSYKREFLWIVFLGCAMFSLFALFSFNPVDYSPFFYSSNRIEITNLCGKLGAYFSAVCFYFFGGVGGYLFLLCIYFPIILVLLQRSLRIELDRLFALCIFSIALISFVSILQFDIVDAYPGGLLGYTINFFLSTELGHIGKIIFLSAVLWISAILFMRYSIFLGLHIFLSYGIQKYMQFSAFMKRISSYFMGRVKYKWNSGAISTNKFSKVCPLHFLNQKKQDLVVVSNVIISPDLYRPPLVQNIVVRCKRLTSKKMWTWEVFQIDNSIFTINIINFLEKMKNGKKQILPKIEYTLPDTNIFGHNEHQNISKTVIEQECQDQAVRLEEKLSYFGVKGKITAIRPGPVVTLFEYAPQIDTKISKIVTLEDDLALALKAISIRIIAPVPGRSVVGFEISNLVRNTVGLSDILQSDTFLNISYTLPIVFGVDITGNAVVEDLINMPHLLVAGATGSGKSVGLNAMLISLLFSQSPKDLKLILIDPKRIEFTPYADIPHLLFPLVTNPRKASLVLKWVSQEMERRYEIIARVGVRNLSDYHVFCEKNKQMAHEHLPFIVILIDELADLMMIAPKEFEVHVIRIAQMARAAGIHLIIATQRPSVDVLTGLIKANFPSRIGYRVSSKIDSKTIIDSSGCEKLLGRGDMLYLNARKAGVERVHGAYVSDGEIAKLCDYLRSEQKVQYLDLNEIEASSSNREVYEEDVLWNELLEFIKSTNEISISMVQRKYRIGFNRSARLIERLEHCGFITPSEGGKVRKILHSRDTL